MAISRIEQSENASSLATATEVFVMMNKTNFRLNLLGIRGNLSPRAEVFGVDRLNSYSCHSKLRFLLSGNGDLFFGREGVPSRNNTIPAHRQLAERDEAGAAGERSSCVTAGDLVLGDAGEIKALNHKSGDFRPSFQSLQYGLAALIRHGARFANAIEIEELNADGGWKITYTILFTVLKSHLASLGHDLTPVERVNVNEATRKRSVSEVTSSGTGSILSSRPLAKRGRLFADDQPTTPSKGIDEEANFRTPPNSPRVHG